MRHTENQLDKKAKQVRQLAILKELAANADFAHYKENLIHMYDAAQHCDYFGEETETRVTQWHAFAELHNFFAKLAALDDPECNGVNLL